MGKSNKGFVFTEDEEKLVNKFCNDKNNLKTLEAIAEKENKLSPSSINKSNYTSNNSKRMNNSNINVTASKAHDTLEQELLGWYDND